MVHHLNTKIKGKNWKKWKKYKYSLFVEKDKIIINAPCLSIDESGKEFVGYVDLEFKNGPKANFLFEFFRYQSRGIVIDGTPHYIEDYLFGDKEIPEKF